MNKKRKVTKRIVAWILCLAVVLTTINLPAFSADVKAAETVTVTSSITIDGNEYALYTGFTTTAGSDVTSAYVFQNMVDGDLTTMWHPVGTSSKSYSSLGYAYLEFSSDVPIILKGYILNSDNASSFHPEDRRLYAKANEDDDYVLVSSYTNENYSGTENSFPISNKANKQYRYFRFEGTNSKQNVWLNEIRLYGYDKLTYTHLTPQEATCTQQGVLRDCYYRNDGKYFEDENGETELNVDACVTAMLSHVLEHYEASANNVEYWKCTNCGKYFSDSDGKNEIAEDQTQIVSYIDSDGINKQLTIATKKVTDTMTTWDAGWYIVSEDVTLSERIIVSGEVHLILADGATLNANSGITVSASADFNVYAQSTNEATMGKLVAKANTEKYAGIGGIGNSNVGSITINGGNVTAIGNRGAGIGSAYGGSVGTITINDGVIDAKDDYKGYGAGIGGGPYGRVGVIDIKGGVIQSRGVGLATADYGETYCGNINIYDGVKSLFVTTKSDGKGLASSGAVTFYSGSSIVDGDAKDAVFYDAEKDGVKEIRSITKNHLVTIADAAKDGIGSNLVYAYVGETVTLTLGVSANADFLKVNDGTNDLDLTDAGDNKYTFVMPNNDVIVTAELLQTYTISLPIGMKIVSTSAESDAKGKYVTGTEIKFKEEFPYSTSNVSDGRETLTAVDGVYSVVVGSSDITITADFIRNQNVDLNETPSDFIALDGDVFSGETNHTIHIADGATITLSGATINGGIICDGSATITLVGENNVTGATNMAGIKVGGLGTTLTIRGDGSLTATGDYDSAGIGLSRAWNVDDIGGDIVIEGGNITAIGHYECGSGIGTGVAYKATARLGNITIKGGVVKTIGGVDADGIGIGDTYSGSTNEIGTVTIYDAVDMVDASSVGKDIIYMHGDTNVSERKNDYFKIIENGERKIIYTGIPAFDVEDQTYIGEAITPKPTVSLGSLNFTEGVDYEYSYSNNVNVGSSATVTVTFKGDYAEFGYVSKSFNIVCDHSLNENAGVDNGDGTHDITCSVCNEKFVVKGNHDFSESEYQNDSDEKHYRICALCTSESGHEACSGGTATCQKKAVCSLCKTEYGELAAHTWDAGEITKVATCKEKGVKTFKCTVSGCTATKTEDVAIDSTNHVNKEIVDKKDATCTVDGYTGDTKCKDCEETITSGTVIDATGHTWDTGTVTTPATCKVKGIKTIKCTVQGCIESKTEEIAIDANNHVNTEVHNAKDATCTEKGYTGDTHCKECDTTVTGTDIAATGHDMTKTVSAKVLATCEKDGKEAVMVCKNCDHTEGGALIKATGHKWDNGTVTKQPTVTAEGVKTFKCTNTGCTETKTESIARLPEPKKNEVIEDKTGNDYEVTDSDKKEVTYKAPANNEEKVVIIPERVEINGVAYQVTKVDDKAFMGNTTVTKVTIPSSVTEIGAESFSGCKNLTTVSVPKNVTTIGKNAFKGCAKLTKVTLPAKTTKIGAGAFDGCKKMKTITIKSTKLTAKTVSKNAFKGLSKSTVIKVPKKQLKTYKKLFKSKGFKGKIISK